MGRKSRMKRERRQAKENLFDMLNQSAEFLVKLYETEGEEGVRKYYKEFGPPLEAVNSRGEVVPMGWTHVHDGPSVFFMDRHMVSDGNGGFICRDCKRGYFECICTD